MALDNSVPPQKPFLKILLIVASVLSVIALGLCAYAVHVFDGIDYYTSPLGFMIFVCIWTWLVTAAFFLIPRLAPRLYNKWIMLGVLGLTAFFWLISFSLLAARVAATRFWTYSYSSIFDGLIKRSPKGKGSSSSSTSSLSSVNSSLDSYYKRYDTAWKVSAAASGIGALIWILVVVTLVFFALACFQHSRANRDGGLEGGEPKPMPPGAPGQEMNHYGSPPPPPSTTTPNPDQQFAQHQPDYNQQQQYPQYNQQQQQQYPPPQQYQQPQSQHIPS